MKIAVFGKRFGQDFKDRFIELWDGLKRYDCELVVFKPFNRFLADEMGIRLPFDGSFIDTEGLKGTDLVLSIGGDGAFLESVTYVRDLGIPIAGINSGRLGFLADISKEGISDMLPHIFKGSYKLRQLDLLEISTPGNDFGPLNFALNELAITKRDNASMITVQAWLNGEFLNSYWADGLIIATATGSTAYSLSVGGPIVHPNSPNFVISPIAPHNLTVRPFVIPNHIEIKLSVNARGGKFLASLDSRSVVLDEGTEIVLKKAGFCVNVLEIEGQSFYNTLRNKLMWGIDKRNWS
ncbi:MAG: NAD kinase [Breznakibacter sp.]